MTISEIVKIETDRSEKARVVHLLKEGSFYHANDWSAWLMTRFPVGEAKNKPMNVTAKKLKDGYIHAFVGFPVTSLGKYVPDDGSVRFEHVSDVQIDVELLEVDFGNATIEDLRREVDEWKATLPLEDKSKKREARDAQELAPQIMRVTEIMNRIVAYPLESKSPVEAWEFLRKMRQNILAIY